MNSLTIKTATPIYTILGESRTLVSFYGKNLNRKNFSLFLVQQSNDSQLVICSMSFLEIKKTYRTIF